MAAAIDVAALIDRQPVGRFQARIVALCFLVLVFDGFDAQVIGFVAPALLGALKLERAMLAPIFTAGLIGYGFGSIIFGTLADRFGRKSMLVTSTVVFGLFTLLKSTATSLEMLTFWQFVAGLGIAGATPNAVALISEYSPARLRATLTTTALSGFLIGSTIGGVISAFLIPAFGWPSIFYVGGIAPLLLVPVLIIGIPESARFLIMRQASPARIGEILRRIVPKFDMDGTMTFVMPERVKGLSVVELFRSGRATLTILLWITMFMTLLVTYFLLSWLPVLINSAGLSVQESVLASAMFPAGGVIGALLWGRMIDRYWPPAVLAAAFAVFAICTATIGPSSASFAVLVLVLFGAGAGAGGQMDARCGTDRIDDRSTVGRSDARHALVGDPNSARHRASRHHRGAVDVSDRTHTQVGGDRGGGHTLLTEFVVRGRPLFFVLMGQGGAQIAFDPLLECRRFRQKHILGVIEDRER
jgi:AAHS family 4-hydroxybenzoate transporter-like MFS transporter